VRAPPSRVRRRARATLTPMRRHRPSGRIQRRTALQLSRDVAANGSGASFRSLALAVRGAPPWPDVAVGCQRVRR